MKKEKQNIQQVTDKIKEAWNIHNAKAYSQGFAEDADFTNVFRQKLHGRKAIEDFHAPMFSTMFKASRFTPNETSVRFINPDLAAVDVTWEMSGATNPQGTPWPDGKGLINLLMKLESGMIRISCLITLIVLSISQFTAAAQSKKLIIDCDPGIDDAMAITLAVQYSNFEIAGITTVFGNAAVGQTTQNALRIVELSDKKIPVYKGAEKPLRIPLAAFPDFIHGKDGLGNSNQPDPKTLSQTKPAAKFIVDITKAYPGQITILAIGPLTNLAEAIKLDSDVVKNVREVVLIGGALHVPGNVSPVAEANIASDPDAADIVFTAPWKVTMIGLNAISKVKINAALISRIKSGNKRYGAFIFSITRFTFDFLKNVVHTEEGPPAYDPSAVMYLIDSSLFTTQKGPVRVVTTGIASGETIMPVNPRHLQLSPWTGKPFVAAAIDVDADRYLKEYESVMMPK